VGGGRGLEHARARLRCRRRAPDRGLHRAGARLTRQSVAAIATPQSAAAWQDVPSTYVISGQDRAVPPPAQEAMSARAGTVHRLPASHSPFLSRPDEVAEIVLGAL
jgi:pimeloyl-ACP methyl ester carboxylesterase